MRRNRYVRKQDIGKPPHLQIEVEGPPLAPSRPDPADNPSVEVGPSFRWRMVGALLESAAVIMFVVLIIVIVRSG